MEIHGFDAVNWLAVLVAALSAFALGGLWYGPLFGKAWMGASGMTPERAAAGNMPRIYGTTFLAQLLAALALALVLGEHGSLAIGMHAGLVIGLFWVATAFGVVYLFEQRPLKLWLVNAGYQVVLFTIMGAILGAWR